MPSDDDATVPSHEQPETDTAEAQPAPHPAAEAPHPGPAAEKPESAPAAEKPAAEAAAHPRSTPSRGPTPHPVPGAHPGPGPRPTPKVMAPAAGKPSATPLVAAPPVHSTPLAEAAKWGRADAAGNVFLTIDGAEHNIGQYPGTTVEEALAYFVRKYDDVAGQITLLEQRVAAKAPSIDMQKTSRHLREVVAERSMVGDVPALEQKLDVLGTKITALEHAERSQHDQAKAAELAAREAIVAEAEQIAAQDPASIQWKSSSTRMNELFDAWKAAQKSGLRIGRGAEDSLWKRFRSARTVFDRHRRAYFSQLDTDNSAAKSAKEKLIIRAEELSQSTDWAATAAEYRELMNQWKATKRASRKDDDALWARFRGAQDKFFAARHTANEAIDQEYSKNLVVKEELLTEAKTLLPITDLAAAKRTLQSIRDRWEEAGKVPRNDMGRMENGMHAIEDAVRKADDEHWRRSNPETKARTNSALNQLESAIAGLQEDLDAARRAGNQKKISAAEDALNTRKQWLEQIQKSAQGLH